MADTLAGFWRDEERTARKDYRCSVCPGVILRGERYAYTTGKSDGEMFTLREHIGCHELERRLKDEDGHFIFGELMSAPDYAVNHTAADVTQWEALMGLQWDGPEPISSPT